MIGITPAVPTLSLLQLALAGADCVVLEIRSDRVKSRAEDALSLPVFTSSETEVVSIVVSQASPLLWFPAVLLSAGTVFVSALADDETPLSEEELLEAIILGDEQALETFLDRQESDPPDADSSMISEGHAGDNQSDPPDADSSSDAENASLEPVTQDVEPATIEENDRSIGAMPTSEEESVLVAPLPFVDPVSADPSADTELVRPDPIWDLETEISSGAGYKTNALLSAFSDEDSPVFKTELEAILLRVPAASRRWDSFLYFTLENAHYTDADGLDNEWLAVALTENKYRFSSHWTGGFAAQYFYVEQAFDISSSDLDIDSSVVELNLFGLRPFLAWNVSKNWSLQWEFPLDWTDFLTTDDDYFSWGPKVRITRDLGRRGKLDLDARWVQRDYEDRFLRSRRGITIAGRNMHWNQHEMGLTWRWRWSDSMRSRSQVRYRRNRDNGAGYNDYEQWKIGQRLQWMDGPWEVSLQASYLHYDYPVQKGDNRRDQRVRSAFSLEMDIERKLESAWSLFGRYQYDEALSNRHSDTYDSHLFLAGLTCQF